MLGLAELAGPAAWTPPSRTQQWMLRPEAGARAGPLELLAAKAAREGRPVSAAWVVPASAA
jgi:hypothetical protein